ncbi:hypothetical protein DV738_g4225, partial [Chaetothyriales sp. CBS 135597]
MSRVFQKFKAKAIANCSKFFQTHSPGSRIFPANVKVENERHQLRIDAGEVKDGYLKIYLQANSEATNTALKKHISKHGTHSNIAETNIELDVPEEDQEKVISDAFERLAIGYNSKIGEPITRQEIFTYSNGRFLINEDKARSCRYVEFDLDQLCAVAVAATGQMKMYTKIPVPKVLGWSSDASNPVGAEYIVMEKAPGAQLFSKYGKMSELQKFTVLKHLTELEGELTKLRFPVYGSLYLRESMSPTDKYENLSQDLDPAQLFCIGPSCTREWHHQGDANIQSRLDRGPWKSLPSYGGAIVEREIARIEQGPKTSSHGPLVETSDEKITALRHAAEVISRLDAGTTLNKVDEPIIWHHDIHMGNLYVSDDDPSKIVSVIDWQHVVVAPLFLQARFPVYLTIPDSFKLKQKFPEPPENYDQLNAEDKESADEELLNAKLAKGYEVACWGNNRRAYKALFIPDFLSGVFTRSSEALENGVTPLIECLIEISNQWTDIGFADKTCPYKYDDRARAEHAIRYAQYERYNEIQQLARNLLQTDSEGWIAPQVDFADREQANKRFLEHAMSVSSNYGMTPEEMRQTWPFPVDLENPLMPQVTVEFDWAIELLDFLVRDTAHRLPTTLVVCCSKEDFFAELLGQISVKEKHGSHSPERATASRASPASSLLTPTLGLLAASQSIKIVYCPSLPVLRAYLAKYTATTDPHKHRLEVLDLIALHHGTSEFTLQGISRTLASLVSAACQSQADLRLFECSTIDDPANPFRGSRLWEAEVPLLSGSIKIGEEGSRWARRGISVKKVASRWFSFQERERKVQK